ncbi:NAD(P)-binding protein [Congregibacter variabilis]|uniref:NAD(P)-binding protein n=1 Tax=Congregibacter variabilis TaxID=3081200 RepID=A0ABZ0I272_9GAMM|nr:NAD(P)-binding protein [Congregibacter sp. IMCC43200]
MTEMETDYLIIGAGAVALAFADTLIEEDPDCHITLVDKHAKPGGHWNDAYGFVALHQPSATYGVNSQEFASEQVDDHGPNKGLHSLASGAEVLAYFEKVMNMRLLPSGRVVYHRLSEYRGKTESGESRVVGIFSGEETRIRVRRKTVDATFYQTSVPSTHTRSFSATDDINIVPPGELPNLWRNPASLPQHYVVLGAGKTAMDTVIWLIQAGVSADSISWVRPRESWLWNREHVQPGEDFFEAVMEMQIATLEAAHEAAERGADSAEMMRILGAKDYFLRIDPQVEPEMFHYAIISRGEIEILRQVKNIIRHGRVTALSPGALHFDGDEVSVPEDSLFIDCTASAVPFSVNDNAGPIFRGDTIVLQPMQIPLVVLSAALAAFMEANFEDDEARNALSAPGPLTDKPSTFAYAQMINTMNRGLWSQNPSIMGFLAKSRLDLTTGTVVGLMAKESPKLAKLAQFRETAQRCMPALIKLGTQAKAVHEAG